MSTADLEKNRLTRLTQFAPSLICYTHPEILRCYEAKITKKILKNLMFFVSLWLIWARAE